MSFGKRASFPGRDAEIVGKLKLLLEIAENDKVVENILLEELATALENVLNSLRGDTKKH